MIIASYQSRSNLRNRHLLSYSSLKQCLELVSFLFCVSLSIASMVAKMLLANHPPSLEVFLSLDVARTHTYKCE